MLFLATQAWPQSKAELSNYEATSSYQEVVSFMNECQKLGAPMTMQWIGESTEGRKIPLAVISSPPVQSAAEARKQGKLVVYIQGNIHAGEVEGKEAALHLLRKIGQDSAAGGSKWLKHMVILMNPIYNADGNEKWGPVETNRPEQDGPKIVGVRANGQGFDLNRDCIKAESPEMRAALDHIYGPWDPDAMLDLHTTDGTRHGFDLTYAAPNNPNTDPRILSYSRDKLLPEVRRESVAQFGKDLFDYGSGSLGASPKWSTFEAFGRYETNYAGLANRIGILSEATTFIPFKDRILATERFVSSVLDHFCKDQATILKMRVPQPLPKEMGVRFDMAQGRVEDIPIEKLAPGEPQPLGGRPKVLEMIRMPVLDRFISTKMARVPVAYLIPHSESKTLRLLLRHGIQISAAERSGTRNGEVFTITKFTQATSAFQGHKLITLDGTFRAGTVQVSSGDYIVPTNQPLGRLVFSLLEPEGEDGVAAWGFMGENLDGEFAIKKLW